MTENELRQLARRVFGESPGRLDLHDLERHFDDSEAIPVIIASEFTSPDNHGHGHIKHLIDQLMVIYGDRLLPYICAYLENPMTIYGSGYGDTREKQIQRAIHACNRVLRLFELRQLSVVP